jgi:hypothetical protein
MAKMRIPACKHPEESLVKASMVQDGKDVEIVDCSACGTHVSGPVMPVSPEAAVEAGFTGAEDVDAVG